MENGYFKWLVDSIDPKHVIGNAYQPLLKQLYSTKFTWASYMPDDENRAMDGVWLRREYEEETGRVLSNDILNKPCSCLEMLIAFSKRIENDQALPSNRNPARWFWMFIENLGLSEDNPIGDPNYIQRRLKVWMERRYEFDGSGGGLFVVKNHDLDMRDLSLWMQFGPYWQENIYDPNWLGGGTLRR